MTRMREEELNINIRRQLYLHAAVFPLKRLPMRSLTASHSIAELYAALRTEEQKIIIF